MTYEQNVLLEEIKVEKELAYRRKVNPLAFFKPLPLQAKFKQDSSKRKGLFGGNRAGKTEPGAEYIISKCLAAPKQRWWASAESFSDSVNIQQRKVWELCPKNRIKYGFYNEITGFPNRKLLFDNGSIIMFKSYDQGRESFQGEDLDGCLCEGTLVAMADGSYKTIENVKSGDMVYSMRNTLTKFSAKKFKSLHPAKRRDIRTNKVLWQKYTGIKKTIIITVRGIKLQLTDDHRVFVSGKGWVEAKNLNLGDNVFIPKIYNEFKRNILQDYEAYWLGLMIGDGYISKKRLQFTCLNNKLLEEAMIYLNKFVNIRCRKSGDRQYLISSKDGHGSELRKLLKKYNLIGTHAYDKFIPQDIFLSDDNIKRLFLRALFSCDGWVSSGLIGYATTSKRLAYDVLLLLHSLGIKSIVVERDGQNKNWRKQWHVMICKCQMVFKFLNEIGIVRLEEQTAKTKHIASNRMLKYANLSKNKNSIKSRKNFSLLSPIKKIEMGQEVPVYDLKIERDENFFANGICVHNCWFDEEPPYDIYRETCMRLIDRNGEIIITMTSIKGITDLIQDIFDEHDVIESRYAPHLQKDLPRVIEKGGFKFYLLWTTENPHIDQSRVEQEIKLMPPEEVMCRIYGMPVNLSGKIYMKFNRKIHVIPFEDVPLSDCTIYNVLDPHDRKPWAMGWFGVHKTGTVYAFEEYPNKNFNEMLFDDKTYDEYAKLINETEEAIYQICGQRVRKRIIDPNFGNKTVQLAERQGGQSKTTPVKELAKRGLKYRDGIDALEAGHLKVREYLYYEEKDGEIVVQPKFFVTDNCQNIIRHLSRYSRKDIMAQDGDVKDNVKPMEKYKDYSDLCRYLIMSNPTYGYQKEFIAESPKAY